MGIISTTYSQMVEIFLHTHNVCVCVFMGVDARMDR